MTVPATRPDLSAPSIPRPRDAEPDEHETQAPWPEPWRHSRGDRPRTEYWDVATASWRSSGPQTSPRPGD